MKRTLGLDRTYYLGQYRNIKVFDSITDIPEELLLNSELVNQLRTLQLAQADKVYLKYIMDSPLFNPGFNASNPETIEEALEVVEEARITSFEKLKEAFASHTEPEEAQEKETKDE